MKRRVSIITAAALGAVLGYGAATGSFSSSLRAQQERGEGALPQTTSAAVG